MLVNLPSVALLVCSAAVLFMACGVLPAALRVLRFWDMTADTALQINLEQQTWLSALLVQHLLAIQLVSLVLLVLAADTFSGTLPGAMCATGAFLANDYGLISLSLKIAGVFFYGFWIVLHRLDLSSEHLPLVRLKYIYFLCIFIFLAADNYTLFRYLLLLEPDIITSCCGVVFSSSTGDGMNLAGPASTNLGLYIFYALAGVTAVATLVSLRLKGVRFYRLQKFLGPLSALAWIVFFLLALYTVTVSISPYIYAMPSHRCPFDILQKEYNMVGYPIYFCLFSAVFAGASAGFSRLLQGYRGLQGAVEVYHAIAGRVALAMLALFLLLVTYYPLAYYWAGGEV
jgi:hypothetical protein